MRVGFIFVVLLLLGCEKEIHINVPLKEGKVTLYSFLYPDSSVCVHLSESVSITSTDPYAYVNDAQLSMHVNGNLALTQDYPDNSIVGCWQQIPINYNDTIEFAVTVQGKDTIRAQTIVPSRVLIEAMDTVTEIRRSGNEVENSFLRFSISFKDDGSRADYYQLVVIREGVSFDGTLKKNTLNLLLEDPVFLFQEETGGVSNWFDFNGLFSDLLINGQDYEVSFLANKSDYIKASGEQKVRLFVYLYHHTYDYFEYLKSTIMVNGTDDFPLFEPVTIHSNITHGVGLVSGMSFDKRLIEIIE